MIKINKEKFEQAIQKANSVISGKTSLPILLNILIETKKDSIKITGTDLQITSETDLEAESSKEESFTVFSKKFSDIIRRMPDGSDISVSKGENDAITVKSGRIHYELLSMRSEDFPRASLNDVTGEIILGQADLKEIIKKTIFSAAVMDETRVFLNGIYFLWNEGSLDAVSTDGHRLSIIRKKVDYNGEKTGIIVPTRSINEVYKNLGTTGDVKIKLRQEKVQFETGNNVITTQIIDEQYPSYELIIPKDTDKKAVIDAETLKRAVERIAIVSNAKTGLVKFAFENTGLEISAEESEFGKGREDMEVEYEGERFEIGFNANYILDVLNNTDAEKIQLEMKEQLSAALLTPDGDPDYRCVVMPMRLN